jgi:hypothetical protein
MSWDLDVTFADATVTLASINDALDTLRAPLRLHDDPFGHRGGWFQVFAHQTGFEAFDDEYVSGFELYVADGGRGLGFVGKSDTDEAVMWTVALAAAIAGAGDISDPQEGKSYRGAALDKLRRKSGQVRKAFAERWDRMSAEDKYDHTRQDDESRERFKERLLLSRASAPERIGYVCQAMAAALERDDRQECERILTLCPMDSSSVESVLDLFFRTARVDLGRDIARSFASDVLEQHFLASARYCGVHAVPYVRFLRSILDPRRDVLDRARATAGEPEMKQALE